MSIIRYKKRYFDFNFGHTGIVGFKNINNTGLDRKVLINKLIDLGYIYKQPDVDSFSLSDPDQLLVIEHDDVRVILCDKQTTSMLFVDHFSGVTKPIPNSSSDIFCICNSDTETSPDYEFKLPSFDGFIIINKQQIKLGRYNIEFK